MYFTRLPEQRLDGLRADVNAYRDLDSDLFVSGEAEYAEHGRFPDHGGTSDLGHGQLDKAWDTLHFLLDPARRAGRPDDPSTPGGAAVAGWHPMPRFYLDEFDYLPRYNTAAEVVEIAGVLAATDIDALLTLYGPSLATTPLYFGIDGEVDDRDRQYFGYWFGVMRSLYEEAARYGQAVFVTLE